MADCLILLCLYLSSFLVKILWYLVDHTFSQYQQYTRQNLKQLQFLSRSACNLCPQVDCIAVVMDAACIVAASASPILYLANWSAHVQNNLRTYLQQLARLLYRKRLYNSCTWTWQKLSQYQTRSCLPSRFEAIVCITPVF